MLRRVIWTADREKHKENGEILHNVEPPNVFCSPDVIRVTKTGRISWTLRVARMGTCKNSWKTLVRKSKSKRSLWIAWRRWEGNTESELKRLWSTSRFLTSMHLPGITAEGHGPSRNSRCHGRDLKWLCYLSQCHLASMHFLQWKESVGPFCSVKSNSIFQYELLIDLTVLGTDFIHTCLCTQGYKSCQHFYVI
jgi:hypothetical protein